MAATGSRARAPLPTGPAAAAPRRAGGAGRGARRGDVEGEARTGDRTTARAADPFGVQTAIVIGAGAAVVGAALLNGLKGEPEPCAACGGTGGISCPNCNGTGRVEDRQDAPKKGSVDAFAGVQRSPYECPTCRGAGLIFCKECKGTGYTSLM